MKLISKYYSLRYFLIGFLFFSFYPNNTAQDLNFDWAYKMGKEGTSGGYVQSLDIVIDKENNIYTTGFFVDTVDFDPGPGIYPLISSFYSAFIQKVDSDGNLVWAKMIQANSYSCQGSSILVDSLGNVYTTGYFRGTIDLDPSLAVHSKSSAGEEDFFIHKMDSLGNYIWSVTLGGTGDDRSNSIAIDPQNNIYATGYFEATVDFNPGLGVSNATSFNYTDHFVLKLDSTGNYIWVKTMEGAGVAKANAIVVDNLGNSYLTGQFNQTIDLDPGLAVHSFAANNKTQIFIQKLDSSGNFVWGHGFGNYGNDEGKDITLDKNGNVYFTGHFTASTNFDPGGIYMLSHNGSGSNGNCFFVTKLDSAGNFIWANGYGGVGTDPNSGGTSIATDNQNNVYIAGVFNNNPFVDFEMGPDTVNLNSGGLDGYIQKFDQFGNHVWVNNFEGPAADRATAIDVDNHGDIYLTGYFVGTLDFDVGLDTFNLTETALSGFVTKYTQDRIFGSVFHELTPDCIKARYESAIPGKNLIINPGGYVVTTNTSGIWSYDSLPAGSYNITVDTSAPWAATCLPTQSFTVVHIDSLTNAPSFGLTSTYDCPVPHVSINAPFLRPGFSNQYVYVQACNVRHANKVLDSAYVIVTIDTLLSVQSISRPYTVLGNGQFRIDVGSIYPRDCISFTLSCSLSSAAILNSTLCMEAVLFPIENCMLNSTPAPYSVGNLNICNSPYDGSNLEVHASCFNDSMHFVVSNISPAGLGDMTCFAPIRMYSNGQLQWLDSVQLIGGNSAVYTIEGNGGTWRLEADQHPLHPGNSNPNASIELCGATINNWIPDQINLLPHDDANPFVDIYCGLVSASYDPNDKTGFPLGVNTSHGILPNQDIEYVIRFQNTGTDTAFTVVVRDTLSEDFNIFSVHSGSSSHDYTFKIHGPRVLEWTFNNISLPDSTTNKSASQGFVTFKVSQAPNLPLQSIIENQASIFFDFNTPIITNTYFHTLEIDNSLILSNQKADLNFEELPFKIYPNPTFAILNIEKQTDELITIHVMDNLGRIILIKNSQELVSKIDLSEFPSNVYYLRVNFNGENYSTKVVKL